MDIWCEGQGKVLNMEWDIGGRTRIVSFKRGSWESELVAAADHEG
jgi:hypothetical protein